MKEEIIAGLKNALERGYSVDQAIQSFITAGYNAEEVKEAANMISSGATSLLAKRSNPTNTPQQISIGQEKNQQSNSLSTQYANSFKQQEKPTSVSTSQPLVQRSSPIISSKPSQSSDSSKTLLIIGIIVAVLVLGGIILGVVFWKSISLLLTELLA